MTFKSFFLLIFISSLSISILFFFFTKETATFISDTGINCPILNDFKFISLVSLISAIFSYIGLIISFYFARKKERIRLKRIEAERINLKKIHEELKAMSQA